MMYTLQDINLEKKITNFLNLYGSKGLEKALNDYINLKQEYVCKTKNSVSKIYISDIFFIEIHGHHMFIHTEYDTFQKYGTLKQELVFLSQYGFIKCSQNCIVNLHKIKSISQTKIHLNNNATLHLSKYYSKKLIMNFTLQNNK